MDDQIRRHVADIYLTSDRPTQTAAYYALLEAAGQPVSWAYEVWDELRAGLSHKDNHVRAISAQLLANLAAFSDPEGRILSDFDALLTVTRDPRTVTARHAIQAIWKVGLAGDEQRKLLVEGLTRRFEEAGSYKTGTLTRYDIIQGLRSLYEVVQDKTIRERALALIETEPDIKYRKKYAAVWK